MVTNSDQYPDTIVISWKGEAQLVDNAWVPGTAQSIEIECRHEMNTGARKIAGSDGTLIEYAMTIYMPLQSVDIPENANYILNGKISGIVKGSRKGLFNTRVWL